MAKLDLGGEKGRRGKDSHPRARQKTSPKAQSAGGNTTNRKGSLKIWEVEG